MPIDRKVRAIHKRALTRPGITSLRNSAVCEEVRDCTWLSNFTTGARLQKRVFPVCAKSARFCYTARNGRKSKWPRGTVEWRGIPGRETCSEKFPRIKKPTGTSSNMKERERERERPSLYLANRTLFLFLHRLCFRSDSILANTCYEEIAVDLSVSRSVLFRKGAKRGTATWSEKGNG